MFQTTRRQLAIWYTTVTAILLLLFVSGVYLYVRSTLIERIDDTLNHVVEVVQRSLVIEPINPHAEGGPLRVNVEASFRDNAATNEDDRIDIEWFNPTGELLWSTFSAPLTVPLHANTKGETVRIQPESPTIASTTPTVPLATDPLILRQITRRIEVGRFTLGYLRVSHPWFEVTQPSRDFFLDLILGTGFMITAVGAIGWFLSGLAIEPVRESYQRLKQFTADASHELRSPIAVIQTNVQVALADPNPDPQTQQYHLKVVERLTRRLGRLVDDLLFLARQDSGIVQAQRSQVTLDTLLREVIEEQQTLADEKAIAISLQLVELAPEEAIVYGDREQLARLFTNLVGNAVQHTPTGGQVTVELQRVGRQGHQAFQIKISDTGIGIPADALPHIFDRFYRVDPSRSKSSSKGSGLGLAIAQAIVQNHQGHIHIESVPNQGTTLLVILPKREDSYSYV